MVGSARPMVVLLAFAFVGALIGAVWRYARLVPLLEEAGVSPRSVPIDTLLIDVMHVHVHALYGAGAGVLLALVVIVLDVVVARRRRRRYDWGPREVASEGADTLIKTRRAIRAQAYLDERRREREAKDEH